MKWLKSLVATKESDAEVAARNKDEADMCTMFGEFCRKGAVFSLVTFCGLYVCTEWDVPPAGYEALWPVLREVRKITWWFVIGFPVLALVYSFLESFYYGIYVEYSNRVDKTARDNERRRSEYLETCSRKHPTPSVRRSRRDDSNVIYIESWGGSIRRR